MLRHVLMMQGPNVNRLGRRNPDLYGTRTLADVETDVRRRADELGVVVEHFHSNHEGALIDWLQERQDDCDAVIVNPAGLTHHALAFRDALEDSQVPVAVVHVTNLHARADLTSKPWRRHDLYADVATIYLAGLGWRGYRYALEALHELADGT